MKQIIPFFLLLSLALWSCTEPASQNASRDMSEDLSVATTPEAAPAQSAPTGIQPPYQVADSSQVQMVEGIQIYVIEKGAGATPKPGSNVVINYHGYLTNGEVFDSSFDKDGVVDFPLNNLIRGWQIGLTQVPTGSKVKLIVPPELAYGATARPGIPANSTLVFDIDLISTY
ncbi:MAG: FKBP-type peptidyl-prolyl cis-trans isomerase [Bacteroidia bacterium]